MLKMNSRTASAVYFMAAPVEGFSARYVQILSRLRIGISSSKSAPLCLRLSHEAVNLSHTFVREVAPTLPTALATSYV